MRDEKAESILRFVLGTLIVVVVLGTAYCLSLFNEAIYTLDRFQSITKAPSQLKGALDEESHNIIASIERMHAEQSDGTLSDYELAQWALLRAVTGLLKNGIINELIYIDEWNRKVDWIFGPYFKAGTDDTLQRILELIGESEVSAYFSMPRDDRDNARVRLDNIAAESPNELYAAFNVHLALTERRARFLGWTVIPICLGVIGALLDIARGVLRDSTVYLRSFKRWGQVFLRVAFGAASGLLVGLFLPTLWITFPNGFVFASALSAGFTMSLLANLMTAQSDKLRKGPSEEPSADNSQ